MTSLKNKSIIGGKALNLTKLECLGYNVPSFIVLTHSFLIDCCDTDILNFIAKRITNDPSKNYAVRSSADLEDGDQHSFAGLFETQLNVPYAQLLNSVKSVIKSSASDQISAYIKAKRIDKRIRMSVIIQEMVDADVSGVAFSKGIDEDDRRILINTVYGLGEALVSGEVVADQFVCHKSEVNATIATKNKALKLAEKGSLVWQKLDESLSNKSTLSDSEVINLSNTMIQLSLDFDCEVDVEFCIKDDNIFILQVRPVTAGLKSMNDDHRIVWDNSNIIESYPGITSPLTFSFIRNMYEIVYTQFADMLGTDKRTLIQSKPIYANMLGHLNGRVYYNLKSWYMALAMLPGYKLNAPFMEKMMGVKEPFTLENEVPISKVKAWWQSLWSVLMLVWSFINLRSRSINFLKFSNGIIDQYKNKNYKSMSVIQMIEEYKSFEKVLSYKWKAPLVNDFFAMIFFGVLNKWTDKIQPENTNIINDLLIGSHDIVSIQPLEKSLNIARLIKSNPNYRSLFELDSQEIILKLSSRKYNELEDLVSSYIREFGDRCPEELKLETKTYSQHPESYIDILKSYLEMDLNRFDTSQFHLRATAEKLCLIKLKGSFLRKMLFKWVLKKTRYLVSNRENLRFQRTKGYGVVRMIFNAIGLKLHSHDLIEDPEDIFYLTKEEIFDYVNGTSVDIKLKHIISNRKKDYKRYATLKMKDRITTYGIVNDNDLIDHSTKFSNSKLEGIGCCAGVVDAPVTVITDPNCIDSIDNTILVTRFTDPGWVRLFPSAAGIIVEKGSLLSHSAIVARELGIPCIVAVDGLMDTLTTGDRIIMDGATGLISVLD